MHSSTKGVAGVLMCTILVTPLDALHLLAEALCDALEADQNIAVGAHPLIVIVNSIVAYLAGEVVPEQLRVALNHERTRFEELMHSEGSQCWSRLGQSWL